MSKREKQAYRQGQIDLIKTVFGMTAITGMFAVLIAKALMMF